MQIALRRHRGDMANPVTWVASRGVAAVLFLIRTLDMGARVWAFLSPMLKASVLVSGNLTFLNRHVPSNSSKPTKPEARVRHALWFTFGRLVSAKRKVNRAVIALQDGTEVTVSRNNLRKIKEAGLLPR